MNSFRSGGRDARSDDVRTVFVDDGFSEEDLDAGVFIEGVLLACGFIVGVLDECTFLTSARSVDEDVLVASACFGGEVFFGGVPIFRATNSREYDFDLVSFLTECLRARLRPLLADLERECPFGKCCFFGSDFGVVFFFGSDFGVACRFTRAGDFDTVLRDRDTDLAICQRLSDECVAGIKTDSHVR